MALDKEAANKILAEIDRNELAQLGCDLTSIPSPTGREKAIAEFILTWFATNGFKAVRQDVEVDRPNAIGILKGDGTGLSLGFNGHTDTSFTGTSEDLRMVGNIEPEADLKGRIVGNKVQGLGISNGRFHDRGQGLEEERHQAQGRRDPGCSGWRNIPHSHWPLAITRLSRRRHRHAPSFEPWDALRLRRLCGRLGHEYRLDPNRRRPGQDHDLRQSGSGMGNQAFGLSDGKS